jgi:hypothetical protein
MSLVKVSGNASGTGTLTIAAPNTNSDYTLTLPDAAGEMYNQGNILGTVSESSGLPTGAIIERGSNANGEFVKYADGTMICTHGLNSASGSWNSNGSIYQSGSVTWTFPATFSSTDIVATGQSNTFNIQTGFGVATTTSVEFRVISGLNASALPRACQLQAIGTWF